MCTNACPRTLEKLLSVTEQCESGESKRENAVDGTHTHQGCDYGTQQGTDTRHVELRLQVFLACAPPWQRRPNAHHEKQRGTERCCHLVEEGSTDADLHATHCFRDQRVQRADQNCESKSSK